MSLIRFGANEMIKRLSSAQKRTLLKLLLHVWQPASKKTFQAVPAIYLSTPISGVSLVEMKQEFDPSAYVERKFFRLTDDGMEVKNLLKYQGYS